MCNEEQKESVPGGFLETFQEKALWWPERERADHEDQKEDTSYKYGTILQTPDAPQNAPK